jgi:hypothetical protein
VDLDAIDGTVARLHDPEPSLDWGRVRLVEGNALVPGPFPSTMA